MPREPGRFEADPESWTEAIRERVGQQDLKGAKRIADEAAALFPDHPEIQKAHRADTSQTPCPRPLHRGREQRVVRSLKPSPLGWAKGLPGLRP
jgi:hypothetical protein